MSIVLDKIRSLFVSQYLYIFWILSFCIPLFLPSTQVITGILVNCFLFLAVEQMSKKNTIPLVILPSLGAISHGILFGHQTIFLYYFLPFIWLGNYILVWIFSNTSSLPYLLRIIISSFLKFLLLQSFAYLYFQVKIVPQVFVSSMGYIQLITAITGGLLAFSINKYLDYERT